MFHAEKTKMLSQTFDLKSIQSLCGYLLYRPRAEETKTGVILRLNRFSLMKYIEQLSVSTVNYIMFLHKTNYLFTQK